MDAETQITLVYFKCRGLAHTLRMLLLEIGHPFQEINIPFNGDIPDSLKQYNISLCMIPCLIDDGFVVDQLIPCIKYLCRKFNRLDLLGSDIHTQAQLSEVLTRYKKQKCALMTILFRNVALCNKNPEKMKEIKEKILGELFELATWKNACTMLYADSGTFLFGHLTVLDFIFYDHCFYFQNFYRDIGVKKRFPVYFAYKNFFEKSDFFLQHSEKLQSYSIIMPELNHEINEGLKKMWQGDQCYLNRPS